MAPFLPVRATSRSQAVRIGKQRVKQGTTTYVDLAASVETGGHLTGSSLPFSPYKELQNHLSIGAVIVVGPLTVSNENYAIVSGLALTTGEEAEPTYAWTLGEIQNRNTATTTLVEALSTKKVKATASEKERIDLFYVVLTGTEKGKILLEEGTAAAKGKAVIKNPASGSGHETWQNLLIIKSYNATETPTVTYELKRA